jgi:hypothetical protein
VASAIHRPNDGNGLSLSKSWFLVTEATESNEEHLRGSDLANECCVLRIDLPELNGYDHVDSRAQDIESRGKEAALSVTVSQLLILKDDAALSAALSAAVLAT